MTSTKVGERNIERLIQPVPNSKILRYPYQRLLGPCESSSLEESSPVILKFQLNDLMSDTIAEGLQHLEGRLEICINIKSYKNCN
jgi:hypothetical protein